MSHLEGKRAGISKKLFFTLFVYNIHIGEQDVVIKTFSSRELEKSLSAIPTLK